MRWDRVKQAALLHRLRKNIGFWKRDYDVLQEDLCKEVGERKGIHSKLCRSLGANQDLRRTNEQLVQKIEEKR